VIRARPFLVALAAVTMVLLFTVPALAHGPQGLIGEGRTDIKEGRTFVQRGTLLGRPREVERGKQAIAEGHQDIRKGQRGGFGH
jgi:hypothetical protein